jgi:peptidoglycan-N-acetylglucosamine deacetylase
VAPDVPRVTISLYHCAVSDLGFSMFFTGFLFVGAVSASAAFASMIVFFQPRAVLRALNQLAPDVVWFKDTNDRRVALTIDDAPSDETRAILEVLEQHGAHATFLVIASRVAGREDVLREIVAKGHELGNHMTEDVPSFRLSPKEFEGEFNRADATVTDFQPRTVWFRPGHGFFTGSMLKYVKRRGYRLVLGDVFPFDTHFGPRFCVTHLLHNVRPGSIMILHDGATGRGEGRARRTARTLARVLPALAARGYRVVSLSELYDE